MKTLVHYWLAWITSVCVVALFSTADGVFVWNVVYVHHHNPAQSPSYVKYFMIFFFFLSVDASEGQLGRKLRDKLSALLSKCLYQKYPTHVINLFTCYSVFNKLVPKGALGKTHGCVKSTLLFNAPDRGFVLISIHNEKSSTKFFD